MSIPLLAGAVAAAYPLVAGLATALNPIGGAAAAIVGCTAALRLLLLPLTMVAVRGERSRAALAPRVRDLQRRYRTDPARLRTELAGLYAEAGTSPLAGLLPALAQAPFLLVLFRIFTAPEIAGHANILLAQRFLGVALSARLVGGGHPLAFAPLLLALLVLAVLAVWRTRRVAAAGSGPAPGGVLALLPFASVLSALVLPLAAVLYLVTTLAWTAVENATLRRGLPARPAAGRGSGLGGPAGGTGGRRGVPEEPAGEQRFAATAPAEARWPLRWRRSGRCRVPRSGGGP